MVYRRYLCKRPNCLNRTINADYLERVACEYINQLLSPDIREQLTDTLQQYIDGRNQALASKRPAFQREIAKLKRQQESILQNMSSGVLSADTLIALDAQLKDIRQRIQSLQDASSVRETTVTREAIEEYFADAAAIDPNDDPRKIQQVARRFIESIVLTEQEIIITPTFDAWMRAHHPDIAPPAITEREESVPAVDNGVVKLITYTNLNIPLIVKMQRGFVSFSQHIKKLLKNDN